MLSRVSVEIVLTGDQPGCRCPRFPKKTIPSVQMAAIAEHAAAGDWKAALRASVTTGIVVAQSASWDRAIGRALARLFDDDGVDPSLSTAAAQALVTTALGVATIYALHRCMRAAPAS